MDRHCFDAAPVLDLDLHQHIKSDPDRHKRMPIHNTVGIPFIGGKTICLITNARVVDPYSFFPDPDPEFDVGDQYGSGSNTDPGL